MLLRVLKLLGGAALLLAAQYAQAQDLLVNAWKAGSPVSGAAVTIDGNAAGTTDGQGSFQSGELAPGEHAGTVSLEGKTINFQFSVEQGQSAVFSVTVPAGGEPATAIRVVDSGDAAALTTGTVAGMATSLETGGAIAGARISVPGTDHATTTGPDGSFELELPRGSYSVRIAHPEYGNREVNGVVAAPGLAANLDLQLSVAGDAGSIEEVVAVASYVPDTGSEQERSSAAVLDVIDSEQIARFGDSSAAAALSRVAGLTIQDGRYAVVRGLQGRYNTTTFNGAQIPSTDPTRRVVPLDMFPSSALDTVNVQKSYSPDLPGNATGGAILLKGREYPTENEQKISLSVGYNDVVTGESVVHQQDGSADYLGFDDGSRKLPTIVDFVSQEGQQGFSSVDPEMREALGEAFDPTYAVRTQSATPNVSVGVSSGNSATRGDNEYGYLIGLKYKNKWELQDGVENTYEPDLEPATQFDYEKSKNTIELGGALSLGAALGYDHKFTSNTLVLRKSFSSTKVSRGVKNEDDNVPQYKVAHEWVERQILSQQFLGEHTFPVFNEAVFDWRFTTSQAKRLSPDRRSYSYEGEGTANTLQLSDSTIERRWDEMTDQTDELGLNWTQPLDEMGGFYTSLKAGFNTFDRQRDSEVIRFGYNWEGDPAEEDQVSTDLNPNNVLTRENINPDGYVLVNRTQRGNVGSQFVDAYDAKWNMNAWYLMGDFDYQSRFQVVTGVRLEDSEQSVNTAGEDAELNKTDTLPAFNATWFARDDLQFRFAWSETVSRPDFTELAPSAIIDPEFGFPVVGNPDLQRTKIDNLDLRGEWYLSTAESISLAFFQKDFTNPIERTIKAASGSASDARTFVNAPSATNEGVELDMRKEFYLGSTEQHSFFLQANYSWIDSEVDLGKDSSEGNTKKRPLQGQSDYIFNAQIGYDHLETAQKVTLLYNEFGERIALVDIGTKPPVMEEPFTSVKVNYEKEFGLDMKFSASIDNLLGDKVEYTQGGKVFRKYEPGRTYEVGFSYQF